MTNEASTVSNNASQPVATESPKQSPTPDGASHSESPPANEAPPSGAELTPAATPTSGISLADSSMVDSQTLARLIAEGRTPQPPSIFTKLDLHRDVLLAARRTGAPIRLLHESLEKIGVKVSVETLRVWLLKEKMPKRRRPRKRKVITGQAPAVATKPAATTNGMASPRPAPASNAPMSPSPTTASKFVRPTYPPGKGPKIARDDF